jgi:hypothetical protein
MKILRKNDVFRKMPEKDVKDSLAIDSLINQGWNYSSKKAYKDSIKDIEPVKKNTEKKEISDNQNNDTPDKKNKKKGIK